jgi:M6 family metalloprotease-like protein
MRQCRVAFTTFFVLSLLSTGLPASSSYSVYQKTLATFSSTATSLNSLHKAQIKAAVDANPTAEKFICTGIRYYSQPMSVNIMVRKRAKAACEYAKQLNPNLSTWYQNKPTQARSYAGKVLLTVKTAVGQVTDPDSNLDEEIIVENSRMISPELCKIFSTDETNFSFIENTGKGVYESTGIQKHFFAFVKFSDYSPQQTPTEWMNRFTLHARDYFFGNSYGGLELSFQNNETWIEIGNHAGEFAWLTGTRTYDSHLEIIRAALESLDSSTDFSDFDGVHVVIGVDPLVQSDGTAAFNSATGNALFFDGKRFASSSTYTDDVMKNWGKDGARVVTHELGHTLGLQDLYAYQNDPSDYGSVHRYVGQVDLMGYVSAVAPSMLNWNKWRLGWLGNTNIYCLSEPTKSPIRLSAANLKDDPNMIVMIRNDGSRLVFEYRPSGTDGLSEEFSGVFAYRVTNLRNGMGSIQLVRTSKGLSISSEDFAQAGEETCFEDFCLHIRSTSSDSAIVEFKVR